MKYLLVCFGLFSAIVLTGCSTMIIRAEQREEVDWGVPKTYAWSDSTPMRVHENVDYELLTTLVRRTADGVLKARGFSLQDTGESDLIAGFFALVETKKDWEPDYGMTVQDRLSPGWLQTVSQEGTLMLYLMDPATKKVIWVGAATDKTNPTLDLKAKENRVIKAVSAIMEKLPVK